MCEPATCNDTTMNRRAPSPVASASSSQTFPGLEKPETQQGKHRQSASALLSHLAAGGGEGGSFFISSHAEDKQRKYRAQRRQKLLTLFLAVVIPPRSLCCYGVCLISSKTPCRHPAFFPRWSKLHSKQGNMVNHRLPHSPMNGRHTERSWRRRKLFVSASSIGNKVCCSRLRIININKCSCAASPGASSSPHFFL